MRCIYYNITTTTHVHVCNVSQIWDIDKVHEHYSSEMMKAQMPHSVQHIDVRKITTTTTVTTTSDNAKQQTKYLIALSEHGRNVVNVSRQTLINIIFSLYLLMKVIVVVINYSCTACQQ